MKKEMIAVVGSFYAASLFAQAFNMTCYASNGGSAQALVKSEQDAN